MASSRGFLYLLKAGDYYKIGLTRGTVEGRINQLRTGNPHRIEEIARFPSRNPETRERFWHDRFKAKRLNGEWFALTETDVSEIVRTERTPSEPGRPLFIYLAGKITEDEWRTEIIRDYGIKVELAESRSGMRPQMAWKCVSTDEFIGSPYYNWPIREGAIFGKHHYVGPYMAYHNDYDDGDSVPWEIRADELGGHAVRFAGVDSQEVDKVFIAHQCLRAIEKADIFFAWITAGDCHGTLVELGYAKGLGISCHVASDKRIQDAWFAPAVSESYHSLQRNPTEALMQAIEDYESDLILDND